MAQINITIPDAALPRVISDLSNYFNYQPTFKDQLGNVTPNPETPAQFAKRMLIEQIKGWMKAVESGLAAANARTQSDSDVDGVVLS